MARKKPQAIEAYRHVPNGTQPPAPNPHPGAYYVSVKDQGRTALLAGPWPTHAEALAMVDTVRAKACELDPRGVWYAYGTARLPDDDSVPIRAGSLNKHFGLKA